jgi:AraC-like DNA-binding protein
MVTVCTILPPRERPRVDAAADGCFTTFHVESVRDAVSTARQRLLDALLLFAQRREEAELRALAQFVRSFPGVRAVALVYGSDPDASAALLKLGASGVAAVVDCTAPAGWRRLRELLGRSPSPAAGLILARLLPVLRDASDDARYFFETLARLAPVFPTVRRVADHLRLCRGTLSSRFWRAGLPSPKLYLARMRMLHAAHLFRNSGLSVTQVADELNYSSPPSFARHIKFAWGVPPVVFRRRFPFDVLLGGYLDCLITPYRETLRAFRPLHAGWWGQGPHAARVSRAG